MVGVQRGRGVHGQRRALWILAVTCSCVSGLQDDFITLLQVTAVNDGGGSETVSEALTWAQYKHELGRLGEHLTLSASILGSPQPESAGRAKSPDDPSHKPSELLEEVQNIQRRLEGLLAALPGTLPVAQPAPDSDLGGIGAQPWTLRSSPDAAEYNSRPDASFDTFANELTRLVGELQGAVSGKFLNLAEPPPSDTSGAVDTKKASESQAASKATPNLWDMLFKPTEAPSGKKHARSKASHDATQRHSTSWLFLVFLVLAVMVALVMVLLVSPFSVKAYTSVKGANPEKAMRSRFVQVVQPFWLPTTPSSVGVEFVVLFGCMMAGVAGVTYWFSFWAISVGHVATPWLFKATAAGGGGGQGWTDSVSLKILSILGMLLAPLAFSLRRNDTRGRLGQWVLLGIALQVMVLQNAWSIAQSYLMRRLMDAMFWSDATTFWKCWFVMLGGVGFDVVCVVADAYIVRNLGLWWRTFVTHQFLDLYLSRRSYYHIDAYGMDGEKIDNPDQRIEQDASKVTSDLLTFLMAVLRSVLGLLSFAAVLWHLLPTLTGVCLGYAVFGSLVGLYIAWKLVAINYVMQRSEADFRYSMVHIRNNTEPIAFYAGEAREKRIAAGRFDAVVAITYENIRWMMVAQGFKSGYYAVASMLPTVLVFHAYFNHRLDFGAITQAGTAFATTLTSLSFVIENMANIADLSTAASRLGGLLVVLKRPAESVGGHEVSVVSTPEKKIEIRNLTAETPTGSHVVVRSLSIASSGKGSGANSNMRVLLVGDSGVGKSSLLRIIAGLWKTGQGEVLRPPDSECLFLPQKPYMPLGDLRTQLLYPDERGPGQSSLALATDAELRDLLTSVGLGSLVDRFEEGFDGVCDWARVLSLGEQQRIASVRCFLRQPKLTILDEATSALSVSDERNLYQRLLDVNLSFISVGHRESLLQYHDSVLELRGGGEWRFYSTEEYKKTVQTKKA